MGRLAETDVLIRLLTRDISDNGLLTPNGGVRRVHDSLLQTIRPPEWKVVIFLNEKNGGNPR